MKNKENKVKKKKKRYTFETRKDVIKTVRCSIELVILLGLLYLIIHALFVFRTYQPYDKNDEKIVSGEDHGFVAISYFGVDRDGTDTLISTERLDEMLGALYDNGYVTISQKDIVEYYKEGKPLPDKALYLMFEDGRKDTAIFAEGIMENYNDFATVLSYAEKFETKDSKFLMPKDLKNLVDSSFWELGTNGYRLSYINVFDRYGRYIGELDSTEFSAVAKYLGRDYNQYLMDYIRDDQLIPLESRSGMENRITNEYNKIEEIYMKNFGYVPKTYVLMHANTGQYANNDKVSAVNEKNMARLFDVNFNREGYSLNNREADIYDLTRMQPQAYWYTNHLLTRIRDDLPEADRDTITFVDGDIKEKDKFEQLKGQSEFKPQKIVLTTESESSGLLKLKDSEDFEDIMVKTRLTGNKLGTQAIILRADENMESFVAMILKNNWIYITENTLDVENAHLRLDLDVHDKKKKVSVEEDNKEALIAEYEALAKYADSTGEASEFFKRAELTAQKMEAQSVLEGAEEYKPVLNIKDLGDRDIKLTLEGDQLNLWVDGQLAIKNLNLAGAGAGSVYLMADWGEDEYSQRNLTDDVYDAVFEELVITKVNDEAAILYDNRLTGTRKTKNSIKEFTHALVNWFIKNL